MEAAGEVARSGLGTVNFKHIYAVFPWSDKTSKARKTDNIMAHVLGLSAEEVRKTQEQILDQSQKLKLGFLPDRATGLHQLLGDCS